MDKRVGLLGMVLVLTLGSGVVAQSPSSSPDVAAQRVEVPTWGFALTLPGDWTAVDTTRSDIEAIVVELQESHPGMASDIRDFADAGYLALFPLFASAPVEPPALWSANCTISLSLATADLEAHLEAFLAGLQAAPGVVGPPEATLLVLPAGDAARVDHVYTGLAPDGAEVVTAVSAYFLIADEVVYSLTCADSTSSDSPDDRWLSVAETFEFLPEE
jgi:hypothetical protein